LEAVLKEAGSSLDMDDFATINEIYANLLAHTNLLAQLLQLKHSQKML